MIALSLLLLASLYTLGLRNLWRRAGTGHGVRSWQVGCFAAAMATLVFALVTLDEMADALFSAHMLQHVLLAVVVPPLLVAGAPVVAVLWAFPATLRRRGLGWLRRRAHVASAWRFITRPLVACGIHAVAIWSWHAPKLYDLALEHPIVHAVEHVSFVGTAVLIWWGILHPRTARRQAYAIGMGVLFLTALHGAALGALITLSHRVWFPAQSAQAAAWGLTPMEDQQLAGLIMWVPAGLLYLVAMSVLFVAWMNGFARRRALLATAALATLTVSGCGRGHGVPVAGGSPERGRASFIAMGCGSCHTVDGIRQARGVVGPPLTGVAQRSILAGQLPNTPDNMVRWIMDAPAIEPGTAMPNLHVADQVARDITAYLYSR